MNEAEPYRVEFEGIFGVVWAESRGKARYAAALAVKDAGYMRTANPAKIKANRDKTLDHIATAKIGQVYSYDHLPT